jgi:hypothetical protein
MDVPSMMDSLKRLCLGIVVAAALTGPAFAAGVAKPDGFYVIANLINEPENVDWAVSKGANAVKVDLAMFHDTRGALWWKEHRENIAFVGADDEKCDCSCDADAGVCDTYSLFDLRQGKPCKVRTEPKKLLNRIAANDGKILAVIIDTKTMSGGDNVGGLGQTPKLGADVVTLLEKELFARGFTGWVTVGTREMADTAYIRQVAEAASKSKYTNQISVAINTGECCTLTPRHTPGRPSLPSRDSAATGLPKILGALGAKAESKAFGSSASICRASVLDRAYAKAAVTDGKFDFVYAGVLDTRAQMDEYIGAGVDGIVTNQIDRLLTQLAGHDVRIARRQ